MIWNGLRVRSGHIQRKDYFNISRLSHSAECSKRYFHKWDRRGKQHLQSKSAILSIRLLSVKMQIRTARRLSESAL